jgi:6-phosphogluconolactonase
MKLTVSLFLVIILAFTGCQEKKEAMKTYDLFVGTYTDGDSKGIYKLRFTANDGVLMGEELMAELANPSFLAISEDNKNLYAVQETADYDAIGGGVTSFAIDNGGLRLLNSKGSAGAHPCHVAIAPNGQIAVSNYTGGSLSIFDLEADGSLGDRQVISHGTSDTLKTAHVHKAHFNEDGLFVADLGLDALKRYTKRAYGWTPAQQNTIAMEKGAGPRHFEFSKNRDYLYVLNELNSSVVVLKRDDEGSYDQIESQPTLSKDFKGENACADIHLSSDGRFLYASNRGENTIVIFEVAAETGKLSLVDRTSVNGDWPRNFTLDPTGNFLLVANQRSNNITVYKRDIEKGTLSFLKEKKTPSPVCLVFLD